MPGLVHYFRNAKGYMLQVPFPKSRSWVTCTASFMVYFALGIILVGKSEIFDFFRDCRNLTTFILRVGDYRVTDFYHRNYGSLKNLNVAIAKRNSARNTVQLFIKNNFMTKC